MTGIDICSGEDAVRHARRCAGIHAAAFGPEGGRAWTSNEIVELLQRKTAFLVQSGHGFLIAETVAGETEILTFAVDPESQGKGNGRAIVEKLIAVCTCQNVNRCILEVAVDNDTAINLYESSGFRRVGIREKYFSRDSGYVSALVMEKSFPAG